MNEAEAQVRFRRIASGDYETPNGRFTMWRVPDVSPPAWNIEDNATGDVIVDSAATMRVAMQWFSRWIENA